MSDYSLRKMQQLNGGWVYSESNLFKTRSTAPGQSKRVTGGTLGNITPEILHSSPVTNDKPILGTRLAPIEIFDSPIREKYPYQQDETLRCRAKRGREEKSEVEICSDPFNKMKKAKMMHQCQNQIVEKQQNESELPSLQIDSDITNCLAACDDDIQFEEKELILEVSLATAMPKESFDNFFYEGENIDDFLGMKDYRVQESTDSFCYEDFSGMEDFRVQQENVDDFSVLGFRVLKESDNDFNGMEDFILLQETVDDFSDLEDIKGLQGSVDDLF